METSYTKALKDSVTELYRSFGRGKVSSGLETCNCSVCMDEDTRQKIISTSNHKLPLELIQEYSNSAHGVPKNQKDLHLLLPRYAELLSEDKSVDFNGVGTELSRFGDSLRVNVNVFTPKQYQAYANWAKYMILHFGVLEAQEQSNITAPYNLFQTLLCGGITVRDTTEPLEELFKLKDHGAKALEEFLENLCHRFNEDKNLDLFALSYTSQDTCKDVAEWLNSSHLTELINSIVLKHDKDIDSDWSLEFLWLQGQFTAENLFITR